MVDAPVAHITDAPPNYMARHGLTLIANGYHVLPLPPLAKVPSLWKNKEWDGYYYEWQRHCDRPTRDLEVDIWARWPSCAIGVAGGNVVGIDIDILDAGVAFQVECLAREILGDTPCKRIGRAPKRMLVYRTSTPFASRKPKPLEILCTGSQFVAYATHPETRQPYEWPDAPLVETDISELPEVTESQIEAFVAAAWKIIPAEMKNRPTGPDEIPSAYFGSLGASIHGQRGTLKAIRSALEFIPNADLDRDSWIRIGHAIKGALGDEGMDIWLDWSRSSSKSGKSGKTDTPEQKWRSFHPASIGAGTVYSMAARNGWNPPPDIVLNGTEAAPMDVGNFVKAIIRPISEPAPAASPKPPSRASEESIPADLLEVGGLLKMLIDESVRTATRPQPYLSLGAAIATVGTLAGRRYRSPTDLRTNVYILSIALSAAGKDHPASVMRRTLIKAGLHDYLGGEDIASGRAILTSLGKHPARLFMLDEAGIFLRDVTGPKAKEHRLQIKSELMKLTARAKDVYFGAEYANQNERERKDIHQPHACLYGMATPETFWPALEAGALTDGFVARLLVFVANNKRPARNKPGIFEPSQSLIEACLEVANGPEEPSQRKGNLVGLGLQRMEADRPIVPYTVPMTPAGEVEYETWLAREDEWADAAAESQTHSLIARWAEHGVQLAMIRAISDYPLAPAMTDVDVRWGFRLAEHCIRRMIRDADKYISSNEQEANVKRILEIIRAASPGDGIAMQALHEKTRSISSRTRRDILEDLASEGTIRRVTTPGLGRPLTKFYFV